MPASPPPGSADPQPSIFPLPCPGPAKDPEGGPRGNMDAERGTDSAAATANNDEESKPFHRQMADWAGSLLSCLMALAFLLLLHAPPESPPALLFAYCYFALLVLLAGLYMCYLCVAKVPSPKVGWLQAAAAVVGLGAAAVDGLILTFLFLKVKLFCTLSLILLTSMLGFWGAAAATGYWV